ncbi:MAG: hypothetical protein ABI781_18700 [Burkholderiales bacterium]
MNARSEGQESKHRPPPATRLLKVSDNCVDRQVAAGRGEEIAIIFGADGNVTRTSGTRARSRTSSNLDPLAEPS